jgi:Skp family chaperone for outer membrane proteins
MKNIITFLCITLLCFSSLNAQKHTKESKEKIKALKVSFITEELNLSSNEAQKFWPIYNKYDEEQYRLKNKLRSELKKLLKSDVIDKLTEQEAENLVTLKLETDKKLFDLNKEYVTKFKKIISYQKIIKLQVVEMEFTRKLMRKYRHKQRKE